MWFATLGRRRPLAKLQTLKQNTEAEEDAKGRREEAALQPARNSPAQKSRSMATIQTQTSPSASPRGRRHRHHHHRHHCAVDGQPPVPRSRAKDSARHSAASDGGASQTDGGSHRGCRCRPKHATLESPTKLYSRSEGYSFMQRRERPADDDSMHERFLLGGLRSVESTPQPRRPPGSTRSARP
ncbi:uncharacterized protein LOC119096666 [Pollicipes pollicipes]|uniref:uncharacterized protein LOC119096666 n=1 Tax=Pollicipes pollicipes TaxID=41117 RepID=UPI00188548A7|nr:uncharacterized protein LOC119096666 [Pollicipes pollicipes]